MRTFAAQLTLPGWTKNIENLCKRSFRVHNNKKKSHESLFSAISTIGTCIILDIISCLLDIKCSCSNINEDLCLLLYELLCLFFFYQEEPEEDQGIWSLHTSGTSHILDTKHSIQHWPVTYRGVWTVTSVADELIIVLGVFGCIALNIYFVCVLLDLIVNYLN